MIETKTSADARYLEITLSGVVTGQDYRTRLIPAIEAAIQDQDHIRVLITIAPDFDRYTLEAAGADARLGLTHWSGFDRVAVVSDHPWLNTAIKAMGVFMPCPVALFSSDQAPEARRWLVESLGAIHQIDLGGGALQVRLTGQIDADVYARETEDLNAFINAHDRFRLLLDLSQFEGWQGLGGLGAHLKLVRDHRHIPERVAIVGTKTWHAMAQRLGRQFLDAPVNYFDASDMAGAKAWLLA